MVIGHSGEARLKIQVVPRCRLCLIFQQLPGEKSSTVHNYSSWWLDRSHEHIVLISTPNHISYNYSSACISNLSEQWRLEKQRLEGRAVFENLCGAKNLKVVDPVDFQKNRKNSVKFAKIRPNHVWSVKVTVIFQKTEIQPHLPIIRPNSPIIRPHSPIIQSFLKKLFLPIKKI
jgi:hypothetical protein